MIRATLCLLLVLATLWVACAQQPAVVSSVLLENGRVWTNDPDQPLATAVVIDGDRIVWVGESELAPVSAATRRIDLRGHLVVPGFNDAHTHFMDGGFTLLAPDLLSSDSAEEFVRRLGEYAQTLPSGVPTDLLLWSHRSR